MNIRETTDIFSKYINDLNFNSKYDSSKGTEKPYYVENLKPLRIAISNLEGIELLNKEINILKESALFKDGGDIDYFEPVQEMKIKNAVNSLKVGLEFLLRYSNQIELHQNSINIKLPEVKDFDSLSRVSKDFKLAIDIPLADQNHGGSVKIVTADSGSIWLTVSLGTAAAVNLVGGICWAAAVIRKKNAEAKIFEAHAKTLEIKNDMMTTFVEAQKSQLQNILDSEAKQIIENHYAENSDQALDRLKLSIQTVSDLIDRGTKILPAGHDVETKKIFPDYSNLNLIESTIRQLTEGK